MAIRYDKRLNNEISRIVRNYNAKIRRLEKTESDVIIPEKFNRQALKSLKETTSNRADLKRRLRELERFTARGGEKNIKVEGQTIPKYQYQNIKAYQNLLKRRINTRIKFYETTTKTTAGKKGDVSIAQMGEQDYLNLIAKREILLKKDFLSLEDDDRSKYLELLKTNARTKDANIWKNNYLGILIDTGLSFGYDEEKLKEIRSRLNKLSAVNLDKLISQENTIKNVIYHYDAIKDITDEAGRSALKDDVYSNFDSIYENLDKIISQYE